MGIAECCKVTMRVFKLRESNREAAKNATLAPAASAGEKTHLNLRVLRSACPRSLGVAVEIRRGRTSKIYWPNALTV
jgi:hypothetical protein